MLAISRITNGYLLHAQEDFGSRPIFYPDKEALLDALSESLTQYEKPAEPVLPGASVAEQAALQREINMRRAEGIAIDKSASSTGNVVINKNIKLTDEEKAALETAEPSAGTVVVDDKEQSVIAPTHADLIVAKTQDVPDEEPAPQPTADDVREALTKFLKKPGKKAADAKAIFEAHGAPNISGLDKKHFADVIKELSDA